MAKKINYKFIRFYLVVFLVYILVNIGNAIYSYFYIKKFGLSPDQDIFGYGVSALIGFIFISFIFFNLFFLIWSIIKRYPLLLIILSLSETLFILAILFSIITGIGSVPTQGFEIPKISSYIFEQSIHFIQFILVVIIFKKLRR